MVTRTVVRTGNGTTSVSSQTISGDGGGGSTVFHYSDGGGSSTSGLTYALIAFGVIVFVACIVVAVVLLTKRKGGTPGKVLRTPQQMQQSGFSPAPMWPSATTVPFTAPQNSNSSR